MRKRLVQQIQRFLAGVGILRDTNGPAQRVESVFRHERLFFNVGHACKIIVEQYPGRRLSRRVRRRRTVFIYRRDHKVVSRSVGQTVDRIRTLRWAYPLDLIRVQGDVRAAIYGIIVYSVTLGGIDISAPL